MIRRDFIRQAGALTGGLLLQSQMLAAFTEIAPSDSVFNVGVIGCGDRGKGIMHTLKELDGKFRVTAICDPLDFRLKEAEAEAAPFKPAAYKDYRKVLDDKSVSAVVIAVPLNLHYQIAADALRAGKHVYLEKTMTYNTAQAIELVAVSKKYPKLTLQVGHQYRYTPLYFRVKQIIDDGYLGKVTQIDCRWDRNWNWKRAVPDPSLERKVNWRMYKEYSGGLPAELLSHQIDFINWAFNTQPDEVLGAGGVDFYKDGREVFDNVQAVLRYSREGMIGNFGATCANAHDGYMFRLKGSKGMISLLMNEGFYYPEKETRKELDLVDGVTGATKIQMSKDGGIPLLKEPLKDGTWYALNDFYKSIREGGLPASNVFTGAKTAICVDMANQAMYQNSIQIWKPSYNLS